jgi:hypothetical protein
MPNPGPRQDMQVQAQRSVDIGYRLGLRARDAEVSALRAEVWNLREALRKVEDVAPLGSPAAVLAGAALARPGSSA